MTDDARRPLAHEVFDLTDGLGQIEVSGDGFDAVLSVASHPILMHWNDCSGSIMQYLLRLLTLPNIERYIKEVRRFADEGWDRSLTLSEQVAPAVRLFQNGSYLLQLEDMELNWSVDTSEREAHFYPGWDGCLIETLDRADLDPAAINRHTDNIAKGTRPCLITCGRIDSDEGEVFCRYIIDGHHKLEAYRLSGVPPRVCTIICRDPLPISIERGRAIVKRSKHAKHYRRWKKKYGRWEKKHGN